MREAIHLLEREEQLDALNRALGSAEAGSGRLVLVTGDAGTGKTVLVRRFSTELDEHRLLWGMCDDLVVPRPLGPLRDMASTAPQLASAISTRDQGDVLDAILEELTSPPRPSVAVIEDAQWADEATVDLIGFIGRRIDRIPALLIVTYRDPGVASEHPLRRAIGQVPSANVVRVEVGPLSENAVAELAGPDDAGRIYRLTGGNPFYVTEVLRSGEAIPATVQDAVVARLSQLSPTARECVELASVVPQGAEEWLLEECGAAEGLAEAIEAAYLHKVGNEFEFPHELTRRAVEEQLDRDRFLELHRRVLHALAAHEVDPARLAHHAYQARDSEAVVRFAPLAARKAVAYHGHREALEHFRQALSVPTGMSAEERATLLEEYAQECLLSSELEEAGAALEEAIALRGDDHLELVGADLALLSEVRWAEARGSEAEKAALRAVEILEDRGGGSALAAAYAALSKLAMVDVRTDEAVSWGEKAVELARANGDARVLAHALNTVGSVRLRVEPTDDVMLVESLQIGLENDLHDGTIARSYVNLAVCHLEGMQYDRAGHYLEAGMDYCDRHDVYIYSRYLQSIRSWWHMEQGRWTAAEDDLADLVEEESVIAIRSLRVKGQIEARRGDPDAERTLQRAMDLAERLGESQGLIPITAALAEWAWLEGNLESRLGDLETMYQRAIATGVPRWIGETGAWLARAGRPIEPPSCTSLPYLLQMQGKWAEAAQAWKELGRPYERADALAELDDEESLLEALEILDRLDAVPRATMVRRKLADLGVASIPRGPSRTTRENPAGLTRRQAEVLELLALGLTYREIAARIYLSPKTVDHHVTAIRTKLGVNSRDQAVAEAIRLGVLDGRYREHPPLK